MRQNDHDALGADARSWLRRKQAAESRARELVALQIGGGLDAEASAARGPARARLLLRLKRLMERERIRAGRPENYDLDRHLALKRTLDRVAGAAEAASAAGDATRRGKRPRMRAQRQEGP